MVADAMMMGVQDQMMMPEDAGRATDTVLAHMTLGEVVIPREIMEDEEAQQMISAVFQAFGADIREFTVGDPSNKINPETGYPEFFFKKLKKIFKKIAPIASIALPFIFPGFGAALGGALGLTGTAASAAGSGLIGAGLGGISGGAKGALLGGVGGGVAGGLGNVAGSTLASTTGNAAMQGATQGSGVLGAITRNVPSLGSSLVQGAGSGMSSPALGIASGVQKYMAQDDIEEQLLRSQGRSEEALQPYSDSLQAGFDPSQLENDAGYQYRLSQGQNALDRSMAAQGLGSSSAALKATQEMGQGLAAQQYDSAYQQWLARNQAGAGVAGQMGGIYGNQGNIQGGATAAKSNVIAETLAGMGGKRILGYDMQGKPIYG